MKIDTKKITKVALIAGVYAVLTVAFAPISYGAIQVRVAEALTVLPFVFPEAVLGLFVGCMIANIFGGLGVWDIFLGSLATLVAGFLTAKMPNKWLAPLPPVVVNAAIVGGYLSILLNLPLLTCIIYIALGEIIACYGLGLVLLLVFEKKGVTKLWR